MKQFLKNWLFKEEMEELKTLRSEMEKLDKDVDKRISDSYDEIENDIGKQKERLEQTFDENIEKFDEEIPHRVDSYLKEELQTVAVDADVRGGSWAVVAIEGEPHSYIKFIDLKGSQIRDIANFLRQFDKKNVIIDTPQNMPKDVFMK